MNRAPRNLAFLVSMLWLVPGQAADMPPSDLARFEPFVGRWEFTGEFLAKNDWAKEFYAQVIEWGPKKSIVRTRETAHRSDANRVVFEGFVYWHPTEGKLKYVGYNLQERFLSEGEIVALERDRLVKEYKVHYPPDYRHGAYQDVTGDVREYRGEHRLVDSDTLELTTFIRVDGKWSRWPAPDAKPFVVTRAATAP